MNKPIKPGKLAFLDGKLRDVVNGLTSAMLDEMKGTITKTLDAASRQGVDETIMNAVIARECVTLSFIAAHVSIANGLKCDVRSVPIPPQSVRDALITEITLLIDAKLTAVLNDVMESRN